MHYTLSENDVRMFIREAPKAAQIRRAMPYAAMPLVVAALISGVLIWTAPAPQAISQAPVVIPTAVALPVADSTPTPLATAAPTPVSTPVPVPVTLPDNTFAAADLKISAPVQWNIAPDTKSMNAALPNGLIHLAGTPLPGQKGMVAIAGHSSNYPWVKGSYNNVFAPLTKTKVGQVFELTYQGVQYRYQVSKVYQVKPNNTEVLNNNQETGIRLITCTPVGTSINRLIVEAVQIAPDTSAAANFDGTFNGSLPIDQ